ncbi:MAG TPA: DUF86 domain-containing protein [Sedimenticola thiotaurini]|uniref:DUF86 domain-containing protein n=1 Tax=Sedimenticola thiotaurini TaxID=1543721 RepID=A0A831W7L8_9GAMM|nr:DUF86 domain-containing protein [Sedimenticola thiotaurini]
MSEQDRPSRAWRFYIDDMRKFAEKVLAYTSGMSQQVFVNSGLTYDATLRNLELIGEAATHVPEPVRQAHLPCKAKKIECPWARSNKGNAKAWPNSSGSSITAAWI